MTQLDLFEWAENRPTAKILDAIPRIAKRMWAERFDPIAVREGRLVPMPLLQNDERKSA
jgi:hypothetical protein